MWAFLADNFSSAWNLLLDFFITNYFKKCQFLLNLWKIFKERIQNSHFSYNSHPHQYLGDIFLLSSGFDFFFFSKKWIFILFVVQWDTMYFYSSFFLNIFPLIFGFNSLIIMPIGMFFMFFFLRLGFPKNFGTVTGYLLSILTYFYYYFDCYLFTYLFPSLYSFSPLLKGPNLYVTIGYHVVIGLKCSAVVYILIFLIFISIWIISIDLSLYFQLSPSALYIPSKDLLYIRCIFPL